MPTSRGHSCGIQGPKCYAAAFRKCPRLSSRNGATESVDHRTLLCFPCSHELPPRQQGSIDRRLDGPLSPGRGLHGYRRSERGKLLILGRLSIESWAQLWRWSKPGAHCAVLQSRAPRGHGPAGPLRLRSREGHELPKHLPLYVRLGAWRRVPLHGPFTANASPPDCTRGSPGNGAGHTLRAGWKSRGWKMTHVLGLPQRLPQRILVRGESQRLRW
mmetsp:Transcript_101709/g.286767  ORF Transcript_101709/g.286767 Transcript_101709/m.286767 type:complete len:216 (+) Transcript_101709:80-727(+)